MASLSNARSSLLDLKVQLARKNREYLDLVAASPQADTSALQNEIASLHAQVQAQRSTVKSLSGFSAMVNVNPVGAVGGPSSSFDAVPQQGSTRAMQSGGAFTALAAKFPVSMTNANLIARTVTAQGPVTVAGGVTGNIDASLGTGAQPNITSVGTLERLNVTNNLVYDTSTVTVADGNLGINTATATRRLHVNGQLNVSGSFRQGSGDNIITPTELGPAVINAPNLRTVGTLTHANVEGSIVQTAGTASFATVSATSLDTMGGAFSGNNIHDRGHTILGNNIVGPHAVFAANVEFGASVGWNQVGGGRRDMSIMNNDAGTLNRGFTLEQRTGADSFMELARIDSTGLRLLGTYPIQFRRYKDISNSLDYVDTDFDVADWHPCIASMRVLSGQVDGGPSDTGDIFHAYFVNNGSGKWRLKAAFKTTSGNKATCHAVGMFVHRSLTQNNPASVVIP